MMSDVDATPLMKVEDLKVHFPLYSGQLVRVRRGAVRAVDGVSFTIHKGETLGLVGESGCGKTTLGQAMVGLVKYTAGKVWIDNRDLSVLSGEALRRSRTEMQMVFQDPFASLNARMTIFELVEEPLIVHNLHRSRNTRNRKVMELLTMVGFDIKFAHRYPTAFSGGQRQRVCIARSLAVEPKFLVCDEPVSALDVSIQAQILNLLEDLQAEKHLTYLFVSHDLSVVRHISNRVLVMYLGKIVEAAATADLFAKALHPYTEALLTAVPVPDPEIERGRKRLILSGELPNPADPPDGCNFCTRCPQVMDICRTVEPELQEVDAGRFVACHLFSTNQLGDRNSSR